MECFTIYVDKIHERLDPLYLKSISVIQNINTKYQPVNMGTLLKEPPQYGANEPAIDGNPKENIRYIRITDIDEFGNLKNDDWKTAKNIDWKYLLKENDILFARSGATAGKTFIYKNDFGKAIFAGYLIRFKFNESKVNPQFVFYYTQLRRYSMWVKSIQRPSGQPNINSEEFKSFAIPLPPFSIQNKIVEVMQSAYSQKKHREHEAQRLLDSINDYILDELGIKLPELKDKMIYIVSSDEVHNKRADAYYYQPKFEEVEKAVKKGKFEVKELKEFITKIHYGASVKNEYVDEGVPLLRIMNLKPNKFYLRDIVKLPESMRKDLGNAFVSEGDLLISRSGTVGVVSVVPKEAGGFAFGSFMIKFCLNDKVNKNYVSAWLNTKLQKTLTEREKTGAIQGNITIETIENFKIPLPSLSVQNKIAEEVRKRMQKAEQLQKEAKEGLEKAKQEVERIILAS